MQRESGSLETARTAIQSSSGPHIPRNYLNSDIGGEIDN